MFDPHNRSAEGWRSSPANLQQIFSAFSYPSDLLPSVDFSCLETMPFETPISVSPEPKETKIYNVIVLKKDISNEILVTVVSSFIDSEKASRLADTIRSFAAENVSVEVHCSMLET
jgi:hypothetical protein